MPRLDGEIRARLEAMFRVEAAEHLELLAANLLELSERPDAERARALVEETFREMHTLKGAARSVGRRDVEGVCQACETLLSSLRGGGTPPGPDATASLDEAVRAIGRLVAGESPAGLGGLVDRIERATVEPVGRPAVAPAPAVRPSAGGPP